MIQIITASAPTEAHVTRYRNWCADTGDSCGHPGNAVVRTAALGTVQTILICRCTVCGHEWREVE